MPPAPRPRNRILRRSRRSHTLTLRTRHPVNRALRSPSRANDRPARWATPTPAAAEIAIGSEPELGEANRDKRQRRIYREHPLPSQLFGQPPADDLAAGGHPCRGPGLHRDDPVAVLIA